jgi:60 kDa SS-A/Ro ribonucleoprotein
MHFAEYVQAFGGWGRGTRTAVARWYGRKSAEKLAYQLVQYQSRDGWSHRDLLRLSHPQPSSPAYDALYRYATSGQTAEGLPEVIAAFEQAKRAVTAPEILRLIAAHELPRECIPTGWLTDPRVWEALLEKMPLGAMVRNLATMTRVGLLLPMSAATEKVVARLADAKRLREARIHPIAILAAHKTYESGRGARGQHTWKPVGAILDALDEAFYKTFDLALASGKRTLLALDVSGSMDAGVVAGVPGLTPRVASAAMALVTAATEPRHAFVAFTCAPGGYGGKWGGGAPGLLELTISPRWRLDRVVRATSGLPFGGTDCAQPMLWATERKIDVDTFVIYTDSETWAGSIHPSQALAEYRQKRGIAAKLVVVGMVSNGFSIADPNDAGMLDVVGFDTATPQVIGEFAKS